MLQSQIHPPRRKDKRTGATVPVMHQHVQGNPMKTILILLTALLFSGCSTRYGNLTVASTKNINVNMQEYELAEEGVTGTSMKPIIIFIPLGMPTIEDAIDNALEAGEGELMQNVVIYYKWFWIPYIYGQSKFEAKGDVYRLKKSAPSATP